MFIAAIFLVVFLCLFFTGLFLLLHAIWDLREGLNRSSFVKRGMLGIGLIVLAAIAPYVFMFAASIPSASTHISMHIPATSSSITQTVPSTIPPQK